MQPKLKKNGNEVNEQKKSVYQKKLDKKRRRRRILIYEYFICTLAMLGTMLAVVDVLQGLTPWQNTLEWIILIALAIDYLTRLVIAENKKVFFKENIFNLIAIIPFFSTFRILRVSRLIKLLSLSIVGAFPKKAFRKIQKFINTNGLKNMLIFTFFAILFGSFGIMYTEDMTFGDAIWWAFVTATTVGYGDLSPATSLGRLIAAVLMIFGIGLIGSITSTITSYFLKIENKSYKEESIELIKNKIDDVSNLTDEDINEICNVLKTLNK